MYNNIEVSKQAILSFQNMVYVEGSELFNGWSLGIISKVNNFFTLDLLE